MTFAEAIAEITKVDLIYRASWPDEAYIYYSHDYDNLVIFLDITKEDLEATDWRVKNND